MTIQLKPEIERIVEQDVAAGVFATAEEYLEHAILVQHQEQLDLAARREEIDALIQEGVDAAARGELIPAKDVPAALEAMKKKLLQKKAG